MAQGKGFVRKHVFIDRKLQGRYMLTFLIPMLVMLGFWLFTLYFGTQSIISTTMTIVQKDVEDKVATHLQDQQNPSPETYRTLLTNVQDYLRTFSSDGEYRSAILGSILWVFGIGIFLVILQVVLLTIFFSHRLAGPVFRLEKACHALIEGNYQEEIRLRKHDEMKNLAALFNEMIQVTRERMTSLRDTSDEKKRQEIASSIRI